MYLVFVVSALIFGFVSFGVPACGTLGVVFAIAAVAEAIAAIPRPKV